MKLTEAHRQGRSHENTCRVCGEGPFLDVFEEEGALVNCSTCIFSFHRSHLFPSVRGSDPVPNGWRCVHCIMMDNRFSARNRRAAERTWQQIESGQMNDIV